MKLKIVEAPNPILNQKAKAVTKITPDLVKLAHDMLETMVQDDGVGLAAPQINKSIRLIVIGNPEAEEKEDVVPQIILFNPKITYFSPEKVFASEGCLSVPGLTGVVERSKSIKVEYLDENGDTQKIEAADMFARVIQHEVDHLDGILFTSRLKHYSVVYYGTADFSVPALQELIKHPQFDVKLAVTETDKAAGRGHQLSQTPVKKIAQENKIKVIQPLSLNQNHKDSNKAESAKQAFTEIKKINPDFQIVAAYGKIIPQAILDLTKIINLNIHPSLLPKYRGPSPIQSAILAGETETGIAIMMMVAEMDAGPLLTMYQHQIDPNENAGQLTDRLAKAGAKQLILTLEELLSNKSSLYEQHHHKATFTHKFFKEDGKIDWTKTPAEIHNFVRAFSPKPGAFTEIDEKIIKICQTHLEDDKLVIDFVQLPGKKQFTMKDLKNGYPNVHLKLNEIINTGQNI